MNEESALNLAREAKNKFPFYRWLYNDMDDYEFKTYSDLPTFSRDEISIFEHTFDHNYFEPLQINEPHFIATTSGTTASPLKVVISNSDIKKFLIPFKETLHQYFGEHNIASLPLHENLSNCYSLMSAMGEKVPYIIPKAKSSDWESVRSIIKQYEPLVILDCPDNWAKSFPEGMLSSLNVKGVVMCLASKETMERIGSETKIVTMYGSLELGCVSALSCPINQEVYHIFQRDLLLGILSNGQYKSEGTGELIATVSFRAFPFIKYSNGDIITLYDDSCTCGFSGRSVIFRERKFSIKLPDANGCNVNYHDIYKSISSEYGEGIIMFYLNVINKNGIKHRILAIFIENESSSRPSLASDLAVKAADVGTGMDSCLRGRIMCGDWSSYAIISIFVPKGSIPPDPAARKKRIFVNGVANAVPSEYNPLIATLENFTNYIVESSVQ